MKLAFSAWVAAAGVLAACAEDYQPAPPPGSPPAAFAAAAMADGCFQTRDISNHRIADARTLYLNIANRDVYRLQMAGACLGGAMSSDPLIIRGQNPSNVVCKPLDLDISISAMGGASIPRPCIVESMVRLTPAEVGGLPPDLRP